MGHRIGPGGEQGGLHGMQGTATGSVQAGAALTPATSPVDTSNTKRQRTGVP
jgi:hypothetical protein